MTDLLARITTDPNLRHGQPAVRGLGYPVQHVLELLASGRAEAEILGDYPAGVRRPTRLPGLRGRAAQNQDYLPPGVLTMECTLRALVDALRKGLH
jgi:hypothetical protein